MLRTWRKKEERRKGRRKCEEKEEPFIGQREKFRSAYTRAAEKCKARLPWRSWNPRSSSSYIFASCHYVSVVELRLQDIAWTPNSAQLRPFPDLFSLRKRAIRLAAVLTRAFPYQMKEIRRRQGGEERIDRRNRRVATNSSFQNSVTFPRFLDKIPRLFLMISPSSF